MEEEFEDVKAKDITIGNKSYLIDEDQNLYDPVTSEHIGMYDDIGDEIIPKDY